MSDLIDRQAAIDAVGKYLKKDGDVITIADVVDAAVAIGMLPSAEPEQTCEYWDSESKFCALCRPSAQPERKRGWWIDLDSDTDRYDDIKCSCCKHHFTVDAYDWTDIGFVKDDLKFCPNCGARMEQEERK